jgi:dTDP-4-amino-4,6-dideoxygalactose transaminase
MEGVMDLAKEFGLYVIEDNAQAIGAVYSSKKTKWW